MTSKHQNSQQPNHHFFFFCVKFILVSLNYQTRAIINCILQTYFLKVKNVFSVSFVSENFVFMYSRLWNKHKGMLIIFWTFFQGLSSLLERVMHIFFQNICYLMVWEMPILRATLNIFAKCFMGYFIPGATFIPESRVLKVSKSCNFLSPYLCQPKVTQYV